MAFTWLCPALLSVAAMLWPAALPPATPSLNEAAPQDASLAGDLLIASPHIGDPRFSHTVILIVEQNSGGALGIVINRPLAEVPLGSLLKAMGMNGAGVKATIRIFAGGPVDPSAGFVLHSVDYRGAGTIEIDGRIAMTESPNVLEDIAHDRGPKKSLVAFGYAGWGPSQLEMELARGDWFVIPETAKLVFDEKRDRVWADAMASRTTPL